MARARLGRARRSLVAPAVLAVSVAAAATLGTAIYLVSTSLPYLVDPAAADPQFGALNRCVISSLREPRAGFAVSPDGAKVAAYGASSVAVCSAAQPSLGAKAPLAGALLPLSGVTAASFDFEGTLWLAVARGRKPELWAARPPERPAAKVGQFAPVALVGVASGAAATDAEGRLALFSLHEMQTQPAHVPPDANALIACNSAGTLVSVLAANAIHVFRAADLSLVRSESPCQAEFLWWERHPNRATIACGPNAAWALAIDVVSGERESAPSKARPRSSLVPQLGTYVQGCDHLPCSVQARQ